MGEVEENEVLSLKNKEFFAGELEQLDVLIAESEEVLQCDPKLKEFTDTLIPSILASNRAEKVLIFTEYRSTQEYLKNALEQMHPIRYSNILNQIDGLYLQDLEAIPDQNSALRFVHFIDKLYDMTAFGEIFSSPLSLVMLLLAGVILYLGIWKKYEPLLLVPIGFGVLLANIPGGQMAVLTIEEAPGTHFLRPKLGSEDGV